MWRWISCCVPSSDPVSTITHELMCGATESRSSTIVWASFLTIMFRQIAGPEAIGPLVGAMSRPAITRRAAARVDPPKRSA